MDLNKKGVARMASSLVPGEPNGPNVKTDVPGPRSKQLLNELSQIQVELINFLLFYKLVTY